MFRNVLTRLRKLVGTAVMLARGDRRIPRALRHSCVPAIEHVRMLRRLGTINAVVDIGANRGQFALAVTGVFPEATVFAFEPLARPAKVFRALFEDNSRVEFHQVAIGPGNRTSRMNVSARDDSSSLLPISDRQEQVFPGTGLARTEEVVLRTLDSVLALERIPAPALLKIDVQGYEYEALLGSVPLLKAFSYVYCECSYVELYVGQRLADEVIEWLGRHGFELAEVANIVTDARGGRIQADLLFARCI